MKKGKKRRSDFRIVTQESKVLKYMRQSRHLSVRKAADVIVVSEARVNHAENGRLDLTPSLILKFVQGYGYTFAQFTDMTEGKVAPPEHLLDECIGILRRLATEKLRTVKAVLESF